MGDREDSKGRDGYQERHDKAALDEDKDNAVEAGHDKAAVDEDKDHAVEAGHDKAAVDEDKGNAVEACEELEELEKKTMGFIQSLGLSAGSGVYFYETGGCFKINWQKGELRGSITCKAKNEEDVEACKKTHERFHLKAAQLA